MRRTFAVLAVTIAAGCTIGPATTKAPQRVTEVVHVTGAERSATSASTAQGHTETARYSVLGCIRSPEVDVWERRLAHEEQAWRRMLVAQGGPNYRAVRRIIDEEGLPRGLALLPAIESGYRRTATGPTGARGLWQFSASTARNYGLVVNGSRDDRLNVELSTRAALRHLKELHRQYGTWPLALAAYNAGPGRVERAMRASDGRTFWDLAEEQRLPMITRKYVPKFLALVRVINDVDRCPTRPGSLIATAE
jgi:hypothetical protein